MDEWTISTVPTLINELKASPMDNSNQAKETIERLEELRLYRMQEIEKNRKFLEDMQKNRDQIREMQKKLKMILEDYIY